MLSEITRYFSLRFYSANYELQYIVPAVAIIIAMLFCILRVARARRYLGARASVFLRGFLMAPLLALAVLAVENYRATDYYRFDSYLNAYEFYHYYIGTKYAREVGYVDMYAASLIADSETGMKWKHNSGTIRDLETGRHVNHQQFLTQADSYKSKFTPERWEEFKTDIVWFKGRLAQFRWDGILRDKGYNGTPVWTMLVGGLLSNRISTDSERGMMFLALLDPLLIALATGVVAWAFGPRTAMLMLILLGTNYMMKWWHMKGAYLRTDWVMCLIMSTCLLKKERFASAGALTGYAMLSRIFPAVFLFGIGARFFWKTAGLGMTLLRSYYHRLELGSRPAMSRYTLHLTIFIFLIVLIMGAQALVYGVAIPLLSLPDAGLSNMIIALPGQLVSGDGGHSPWLKVFSFAAFLCLGAVLGVTALWGMWAGKLERKYFYFMLAFGVVTLGLTGVSKVYWRGTDYWDQYTTKISKHSRDISTWRVGYKYIFMADFGDDFSYVEKPLKEWQPRVRSAWYNERQPEWWHTQILVLVLSLLACAGLKDYRAYLLGFVPLFFLVAPTYYYYIMLLVPLLFFAPRVEHFPYALGLSLMYVTGMSGFWFYSMWRQDYATYYWLSVQVMVMALYMVLLAFGETFKYLLATSHKTVDMECQTQGSVVDSL